MNVKGPSGSAAVERALRLVVASGIDHDLDAPASESLVRSAELRLGLTFPPSYRTFLRIAGCGGVQGEEFYGLVADAGLDVPGVPNAVWLYETETASRQPRRYFQIYNYGDGTAVALDLERQRSDGEVPCVASHAGRWQQTEDVATEFGTFFLAVITDALGADATSA
jgi:antitoxin YobK